MSCLQFYSKLPQEVKSDEIVGAIAAATPGMEVPLEWADRAFDMLDDELKEIFIDFHNNL